MKKFRWIEICFLLTALPQFTEAATKKSLTVTYGEDVTLTCDNSRKPPNKCKDTTTWTFAASGTRTSVELITEGKIREDAETKHRLHLTEDCSLVINVQEKDAGRYDCLQYTPVRHDPESFYNLSVYKGGDTEKTTPATPAKPSTKTTTKTTASIPITSTLSTRYSTTLQSNTSMTARREDSNVEGENTKKTTPATTSAKPMTKPTTASTSTATRYSTTSQSSTTAEKRDDSNGQNFPWWSILVAAVAFILTVVVVVKVIRRKGNKTQTGDSPDDPEEGVPYATISYSKNQRNTKGDGKAEDDHVTYSTVKTSSSSAAVGASTDPSNLYSTVNKGKK